MNDDILQGMMEADKRHRGALSEPEIMAQLDTIRSRPPVPYRPPVVRPVSSAPDTFMSALMPLVKPVSALVAVSSGAVFVVRVVAAASAAVGTWIEANGGIVVGAVAAVAGVASLVGSRGKSADPAGGGTVGGGGGVTHIHYHQYNYQGQGPQNNNEK